MNIEKFRNIPFIKRDNCIVCGKELKSPLIRFPKFPLTEIYVKEKVSEKLGFVDQAFHYCMNCGHGQLENVIEPKFLYGGDNYFTRTSTSQSAKDAVEVFIEFINENLKNRSTKNIIEIGCNDTYLLKRLKNHAGKLYGIDPIVTGREAEFKDDQITPIGDFFENVNIKELGIELDVVLSSHTLEHIPDPKALITKLIRDAHPETIFIFQFPGLEPLIDNSRFEQVHHQHINYFSLKSFNFMLNEVGGELIDFKFNPYHWGTLMVSFQKKRKMPVGPIVNYEDTFDQLSEKKILDQYKIFNHSMELINRRINSYKGEKIYGFGAALMLPLMHYHIKNLVDLEYIIDDDKNKNGLYYINFPLKIVHHENFDCFNDSIIIITAMTSKQVLRAITKKLIDLKIKEIIIPTNLI